MNCTIERDSSWNIKPKGLLSECSRSVAHRFEGRVLTPPRWPAGTETPPTLGLRIFTLSLERPRRFISACGRRFPEVGIGDSGPGWRDSSAVPFWEFSASSPLGLNARSSIPQKTNHFLDT